MKPSVAEALRTMRAEVGEGRAGRFLQRLLALALVKSGARVEDEQTCEGPDIVMHPYQIEVKTTESEPFEIRKKDVKDMEEGRARQREPLLALLALDSFDGWIVVRSEGLSGKTLYRWALALRRVRELEARVDEHFDAVAEAWLPRIRRDREAAFQAMDDRRKRGEWAP